MKNDNRIFDKDVPQRPPETSTISIRDDRPGSTTTTTIPLDSPKQ